MSKSSLTIAAAVSGVLTLAAAGTRAEEPQSSQQLEAVVVTGSYIKRSDYQPSSPVDVLSRAEIDVRAPQTVANYLADLPYNFGSAFSSGRALGNERGAGTVNLRGLGPSATLVLINSRRQTQVPDNPDNVVDVNSLVPEIMIERTEILKDGASALYGTDAVAGVVNFITRDRFDGFRVSARGAEATYSHKGDQRIEALWGTQFGSGTHLTAAVGIYDQDLMPSTAGDAPSQRGHENDIRFSSASSWPGEFVVPLRDANGALIAGPTGRRSNVVDSECGTIVNSIPARAGAPGALPVEQPTPATALDCRYQFWNDNALQSGMRRYQGYAKLTQQFTDTLNLSAELGYASVHSETSYTAGDTLNIPVTIPGHNPGNTFRAVDSNGNPLFAMSSGVDAGFMRDGAEVFLPLRSPQGVVQLAPVPTVQSAGTIPFYEDVSFSGRPIGSQGGLATNNALGPGVFAAQRLSEADNKILRGVVELRGSIGSSWDWTTALTYSKYKLETNGTLGVALTAQLNGALNGFGGANCDPNTGQRGVGNCSYFNLFGNRVFATTPGDPQANSQAVVDYVVPKLLDTYNSKLLVGDAVISGKLFELPGGPFGVAAGFQYRDAGLEIDFDINKNVGNTATGTTQDDFDQSRSTNAYFVELNAPLLKNAGGYLELNAAVRHEDSGGELTTTDPKFGVLYTTPGEMLSLRGSYGTSFVAPSLFRLYSVSAGGAAVNDCPPAQNPVCTGDTNLRISAQTRGNPDLKPQTSEALSFGTTLRPIDDLSINVDWWHFTFEDLITTETASDLVASDPDGSITGRVFRDSSNRLLSVAVQYFNASAMKTSGFDASVDYSHAFNALGKINVNLSGTYMTKYEIQQKAGGPVVDALGQSNDGVSGAAPNTKLRANLRGTWSSGAHSFTALLHYYDSLVFTRNPSYEIASYAPLDVTYSYSIAPELVGLKDKADELRIAIGANNVFDRDVPYVPYPGFQPFIPSLYDLRGRIVWLSLAAQF